MILKAFTGKTVRGNLRILNREMLTNTTLGVNASDEFSRIKVPKEVIVIIKGAHVHKNVLDMLRYAIFFMYPNSVLRIFPTISLNDNSHP